MAETKYANLLQKRMTADEWAAANPLLMEAQFGLDTTSGIVKMGNGRDLWLDLPVLNVALEFDPATGTYQTDEVAAPIVSVNSDSKQFPDLVRTRQAANLRDPSTPEGQAILSQVGETALNALRNGATGNGTTDDTAAIQGLLDSSLVRTVYLPAGTYLVTALSIPVGKHLTGEYTSAYTSVPTRGSVIVSNITTGAIITLGGSSQISNVAISGNDKGSTGVILSPGQQAFLRDATISNCAVGLDGNYRTAWVDHCSFHNNSLAIKNPVDSWFQMCVINANSGVGISLGVGSNSNTIVSSRIEWNTGAGIDCLGNNNLIVGNMFDRNGQAGLRLRSCTRIVAVGNRFSRNGSGSSGQESDCNIQVNSLTGCTITGNTTSVGTNDDGSGYNSPLTAISLSGTIDRLTLVSNDLTGGTANSVRNFNSPVFTNTIQHSNQMLTGSAVQVFNGKSAVAASTSLTVGPASSSTYVAALPILAANGSGATVLSMELVGRWTNSGNMSVATTAVAVTRGGSGSASVANTGLSGVAGSDWGTKLTVSYSVSADGSSLTVTVNNTDTANTAQVSITAR